MNTVECRPIRPLVPLPPKSRLPIMGAALRGAGLACLLLVVVLLVKCLYAFEIFETTARDFQAVLATSGPQILATINDGRLTIQELRGAAREQRSYYKATGKALAIATIDLARGIESADALIQRTDSSLNGPRGLFRAVDKAIQANSDAAVALMGTTEKAVTDTSASVTPPLDRLDTLLKLLEADYPVVADDAKATLAHTNKATGHVAETAETLDIATRGLRDKGKRVVAFLKWVMGRFTYPIR